MFPTILILLVLGFAEWRWLRGPTGGPALRLCLERPRLFAPAAALLAVDLARRGLPAAPFWSGSLLGISLALSAPLLLSMAAHVACVAWLVRDLGAALLGRERALGPLLAPVLAVLFAGWVAVFGMLAVVIALGGAGLLVPALLAWGALLVWLNARAAPFGAALLGLPDLPLSLDGLRTLRDRALWLHAADPKRWRKAVLAHLMPLGLVTFVWLSGHTTVHGPNVHVRNVTNFAVHGEYAPSLSLDSSWPEAIYDAIEEPVPPALDVALRALMGALGTVCFAAYARIGLEGERREEAPGAA